MPPSLANHKENNLEGIHGSKHRQRNDGKRGHVVADDGHGDQERSIQQRRRLDKRGKQPQHGDKTRRQTAEAVHFSRDEQLKQIVDRSMDPPFLLGQQDGPVVMRTCVALGIDHKRRLHIREMLEDECREMAVVVWIEQMRHVQGVICRLFSVVGKHLWRNQDGRVVGWVADTVHAKAARQTVHGAKQRFKRLGQALREKRVAHVEHAAGDARVARAGEIRVAARAGHMHVPGHVRNHVTQRVWVDLRVCTRHEHKLVKRRIDANHALHLMAQFQLERCHGRIQVHAVQISQQNQLAVSLASK